MPISYTALASEINNDPQVLGYAPHKASGNHIAIANLLNAPGATTIDRGIIKTYEIIDATVPAEWAALTAQEKTRYSDIVGAGEINVKNANLRSAFAAMFGAGTTTRTNLSNLQTRPASRAEVLFGEGTIITHMDVGTALRG